MSEIDISGLLKRFSALSNVTNKGHKFFTLISYTFFKTQQATEEVVCGKQEKVLEMSFSRYISISIILAFFIRDKLSYYGERINLSSSRSSFTTILKTSLKIKKRQSLRRMNDEESRWK